MGMQAAHGLGAEPLLQAVDQLGKGFRPGGILGHAELDLSLVERLGDQHVQGGGLETEIGIQIEAAGEAIQPQGDQTDDMLRIAARRGKAEFERQRLAVHPEQQQAQYPRTDGIASQITGQIIEQMPGGDQYMLLAGDRLDEGGLRGIDRRRHDRDERLGHMAQRLVEAVQRIATERAERFVGRTMEVLVEGPSRTDRSRLRGRTRHNKTVNFTGVARAGELADVEIGSATSTTLAGEESLLARVG